MHSLKVQHFTILKKLPSLYSTHNNSLVKFLMYITLCKRQKACVTYFNHSSDVYENYTVVPFLPSENKEEKVARRSQKTESSFTFLQPESHCPVCLPLSVSTSIAMCLFLFFVGGSLGTPWSVVIVITSEPSDKDMGVEVSLFGVASGVPWQLRSSSPLVPNIILLAL